MWLSLLVEGTGAVRSPHTPAPASVLPAAAPNAETLLAAELQDHGIDRAGEKEVC